MNTKIMAELPVYRLENVTYTPYIDCNEEIWLHSSEGGDEPLYDIDGMSDSEVWELYGEYDTHAMREFADEVEEYGDAEAAYWLRGWSDHLEYVQRGEPVDVGMRERVLSVMRSHAMDEAKIIDADDEITVTEVWRDEYDRLYRIDTITTTLYLLYGSGKPALFDKLATARAAALPLTRQNLKIR